VTVEGWEQSFVDAVALSDDGDPQGAFNAFLTLIARDDVPAYARALASTNIATMLVKTQRTDEAMEWYERAVAFDPGGEGAGVALGAKGMLLHSLGRSHECLATFERMLALPALPEASRAAAEQNLKALRAE
jgi:predicted RNA polymerase sigma factor